MLFALRSMLFALCSMLYALCPMLYAYLLFFFLYAFGGMRLELVLLDLYTPFLSTLDWAESAGQPDLRLQDGAEIAINARKMRISFFFMP